MEDRYFEKKIKTNGIVKKRKFKKSISEFELEFNASTPRCSKYLHISRNKKFSRLA